MKSSAMMCCGHTAADINAVKSPRPISAAGSPTTGPASGGGPQPGASSRGNIFPQHNLYGSVPMAAGRGSGTTGSAPTPLPANAPAMPRAPPPPPPSHAPPPVTNRRGPSPVPSHRATSPSASKRQPTTMATAAGIEPTVPSDAVPNASFSNTLRGISSRPRAPSVAELSLVRKRSATLPVGGSPPALGRGLSSGRLLPPSASSPFASRSRAATHLMTDDDNNVQAAAQGGPAPVVPIGTSPQGTAGAPSWEALHQVQTRSGHAAPTASVINAPPSRHLAQQEQQQQQQQPSLIPDATLPGNAWAATPVGSTRIASHNQNVAPDANNSQSGAIVARRQPSRTSVAPAAAHEEEEFLFSSAPPPIPVERDAPSASTGVVNGGVADIDAVFVRSLSSTSATMPAVDDQPHHQPQRGGHPPGDRGVVEASPMRPYTLRGALDRGGGINNAPPSSEGLSSTMNHHYDASSLNAAPVFEDNRNEQSQALPDSAEISPDDLTSIHASLLVNSQRRQQAGTAQATGYSLSQNHGRDGNTVNDARVPGTTTVSMSVSSVASAGGRSLSSPAVPPAAGSLSAQTATFAPGASTASSTTRVGTAPPQTRPPSSTATVAPPPVAAVLEGTAQQAPVDYPSPQTDRDRLLDALSLPSPPTAATTKAAAATTTTCAAASRTNSITVLVEGDDDDRHHDTSANTNRPLYRELTAAATASVSQSCDKKYFSTLASVQAYLGRVNMRHEDDTRLPTRHAGNASLSFSPSRDAPHYSSAYATAIAPVPPPTATNLLSATTSYSVPAVDGMFASSQGMNTVATPRLINASTPFAVLYPAHRGPAAGDGLHQAACDRMRQQEGLRHATNFRDGSPLGHVPAEEFGRSAYAVPHSPRRIGGVLQREGGMHFSSSSSSAAPPTTDEVIAQTRQYREEVAFQHRDHNGRYSPPRRLATAGGAGGAGQLRDTTDLRRIHSASATSTHINQTNRGGFSGYESPRKPPPVRAGDALSTSSTFQPASFFEGCSADYFKAKRAAVASGPDPMALESSPTRRRDLRVYGNETDTTRREASILTFPAADAASFNRGGGGVNSSSSHVFSERFDYHNHADPYRASSVSSPGAVDRMLAQARAVSEEQTAAATLATDKEWTSSATTRIHAPVPAAHPQHHRDHRHHEHHHQHKESIVLSTPVAAASASRFHSTNSISFNNNHHASVRDDRFASTPTEILATARGLLNTPTVSPIVTGGGRRRV